MKNRILTRLGSLSAAAVSLFGVSCAYMGWGINCDHLGNCVPAIKIEGVFCNDGEIAPSEAECLGNGYDGPSSPWELKYSTNYGLSMSSTTNTGILRLYKDGSYQSNIGVQFNTIGNSQVVANPSQVQADVEAQMTSQTATYSFELTAPPINISTSAVPGTMVTITAKLRRGSTTIKTDSMTYIADVGGGPKTTTEEYGGPN